MPRAGKDLLEPKTVAENVELEPGKGDLKIEDHLQQNQADLPAHGREVSQKKAIFSHRGG